MPGSMLLCADGSDLSTEALASGMKVLRADLAPIIATVVPAADPMLVSGTGFAGGTMSPDAYEDYESARDSEADAVLGRVAAALGLESAKAVVLRGDPGAALCDFAVEQGVEVIIIGTRGLGGLKRALLGSVSDHVVRNAPCPVLVA